MIENRDDAPVKSRFQREWPGSSGRAGVQHLPHLGARLQPARHLQPCLLLLLEAQRHGADAAQRQERILGRDDDAQKLPGRAQLL